MWSDEDVPVEAADAFRRATKERLVPAAASELHDRSFVERILRQRPPFLFTHRVMSVSRELRGIETRFELEAAGDVFAGHFPEMPLFPAVLQLEAIGQAGMLAYAMLDSSPGYTGIITHVYAARFLRPVKPKGELAMIVRVFDAGMFLVMVGQCLQGETICSAACLAGVAVESPMEL